MFTIPGYTIPHTLHESANSLIYRGVRTDNNQTIILKTLRADYPTPRQISQFTREYEFTKDLKIPGIRHAIETIKIDKKPGLILEYVDGITLNEAFVKQPPSFPDFLKAAIQIARIVGELHHQHIIHKDINPGNILIGPQHNTVTIIDFGIATKLTLKKPFLGNLDQIEGTLPYMSPEQSGRMNRSVDFRSDLYSLGATLYACVVGHPPFEHDDPLTLIHAHIAKPPTPPIDLIGPGPPLFITNHAVLHALSDVIMKLLSKKAEDRYQSALGLRCDLEQIAAMLEEPQTLFQLGRDDVSEQLLMPETLYGREHERDTLLAAFERVANGQTEIMLVAGYSGIGKSVLVKEIYTSLTEKQGYFASGKFDQFQRNIPYSAIVNAFGELAQQLLTESEVQLSVWKKKLLTAFGSSGQVMIDIIPELALIIGPQSETIVLGPAEAQNRFNLLFRNFMKVFTQPEHPLVLVFDDLQWADKASLGLISLLMTAVDSRYLFIIGAYRDNEVTEAHPLMLTLAEIQQAGRQIHFMNLSPLSLPHITQFVADALHCPLENANPLAELVLTKTNGNPFFITEFLRSLYAEKLVKFDFGHRCWQWDLPRIHAHDMTDNVVELMAAKTQQLSPATQHVLQLAACMGNQFDLKTLAIVYEQSLRQTAADLWAALAEGLVVPLGEGYKVMELDIEGLTDDITATYKFAHDRI